MPIRNAAGPSLNGAFSVAGPCGGVKTFGVQGVTTVVSGSVVSLQIAYNGGHKSAANAFHVAAVCGSHAMQSPFDDAPLKLAANTMMLIDGSTTVPAADSSTTGYTLTFKSPVLAGGSSAAPTDCVFSLLDQRGWGGCVDVTLVPGGSSQDGGSSTTLGQVNSPCDTYCDMMETICTGSNQQYPAPITGASCMTTCGNFSVVATEPGNTVYAGDNLQCRQHHLEFAASSTDASAPATHCPHAGAASTSDSCFQSIADGHAPASPCANYCHALTTNCADSAYFTSHDACLATCAGFITTGLGADVSKGDTLQCHLASATGGSSCADANPVGTGECATANPLKLNNDTLSAIYHTSAGQCDTSSERGANTISGCCCLSGTVTVIHVKGSVLAAVTANLTATVGEMCRSGFMSIPNGVDSSKPHSNYTFASPIVVNQPEFVMKQGVNVASTELVGNFTIAGDPFQFQLADGILVITNAVAGEESPRVCSVQAQAVTKIDTSSGYYPPGTNPINAAHNAHVSMVSVLAAGLALVLAMRA